MSDGSNPLPKIDRIDFLEAENLQLQLQNVQMQMQIMQSDLQKALQTKDQIVQKMNDLRVAFLAKYGVDLASIRIHDDGTYELLTVKAP